MPQLCTAWVMVTTTSPAFCEPPLFIGRVFFTSFDSSQRQHSKIPMTSGENFLASGTASWMWSKWSCETQIVSIRSISKPFGYFGLPSVQGSITMTCPEGRRKWNVPWPSQVICMQRLWHGRSAGCHGLLLLIQLRKHLGERDIQHRLPKAQSY